MSRIGRMPVAIPATVKLKQEGGRISVEGPKGALSHEVPDVLKVTVAGTTLSVARSSDAASIRALHGLHRALIANMVKGVEVGFSKELEIVGIGYRAQVQGKTLTLNVGFSHPVLMPIPEGITVQAPKPTSLIISGADKHDVGQFAANVRRIAPPEPYKGKGIKYVGEIIRRKAGKAATGAGAKAS